MKDINNYVVTFNGLKNSNVLFSEYQNITGKNPCDALSLYFNKKFKRVTGDDAKSADIIIVKGYYEDNVIHCGSRYVSLCYKILEGENGT